MNLRKFDAWLNKLEGELERQEGQGGGGVRIYPPDLSDEEFERRRQEAYPEGERGVVIYIPDNGRDVLEEDE